MSEKGPSTADSKYLLKRYLEKLVDETSKKKSRIMFTMSVLCKFGQMHAKGLTFFKRIKSDIRPHAREFYS